MDEWTITPSQLYPGSDRDMYPGDAEDDALWHLAGYGRAVFARDYCCPGGTFDYNCRAVFPVEW